MKKNKNKTLQKKQRIDVTGSVMTRVAGFEREQKRRFFILFAGVVLVLLIIIFVSVWIVAQEALEKKTYELLLLFQEDWEIISEYWVDSLDTLLVEIPGEYLLIAGLGLMGLIGVFVMTRKRRKKIKQLSQELAKYEATSHNRPKKEGGT